MFRLYFDAHEEITLPISCDPVIVEANSDEALGAYQETSDPTDVIVPLDGTTITFSLDPDRLARARDAAGQIPMLGERVGAHARAAGEGLCELEAELAVAKAFDALDETEREALRAYRAWQRRISLEVVCAVVVRVSGWDFDEHPLRDSIEAIRPASHRDAFVAEAYIHISRLERLDPEKKGRSGLLSGQRIQSVALGDVTHARSTTDARGVTAATQLSPG